MAALNGATLTTHADFRPVSTVDPNHYAPAIVPEIWIAQTHIVWHGPALTHSVNVRGSLADTDVEAAVAELDAYTDVAPTAPSQTDITPAMLGISTPIGAQTSYFPGAGGWSAENEVMAQHIEAIRQYEDEFSMDLIASYSNSTTLGATLGRDQFIAIKVALMAQSPEGSLFHALMHTSDFENFVKDVGSLGNPLALGAEELLRMKPAGYQGMYEGVGVYASSRIDQFDADEWQGAMVAGVAFDPAIYPMPFYQGGGSSGLIMGPNRMTLVEFFAAREADLASDARLGMRRISYRYRGHATVAQKQARKWRSNKS